MRFTITSVLLIVTGFIFLIIWGWVTFLLQTVNEAMSPHATGLDATFAFELDLIPAAFGVIAIIFFVAGILATFFLESFSDEPEMYWR